jgi:formylmethanofuran dehydrogenase subunit E
MDLPREAEIYPSIRCALCGEKVMEPRARVKDGKIVCIPCFEGTS